MSAHPLRLRMRQSGNALLRSFPLVLLPALLRLVGRPVLEGQRLHVELEGHCVLDRLRKRQEASCIRLLGQQRR